MWNRKLGRTADHRKAMFRNLATSLIIKGQVETTEMKAKELRTIADELVTLAKRGDLHARRQAAAFRSYLLKLVPHMQIAMADILVLSKREYAAEMLHRWPSLNL